jgi:hypothetical protein
MVQAKWLCSALLLPSAVSLLCTLSAAENRLPQASADAPPVRIAEQNESARSSLLFRVSGSRGAVADFSAGGSPEPTFLHEVTAISDGASGAALRCGHTQLLAWRAPGNIVAQRGTLAFFWRSREPVGPTEFPIFRVGYADHSSWDMVWLRLDYNGHGFDAFVTDTNLARTRVSVSLPSFPKPDEWVHLAFTWDETQGVKLFVNGKLAGENPRVASYDAGLDQFGPHSRIISPYQVQSAYNFVRGGDIDEIEIHDHALSENQIARLAVPPTSSSAETARLDARAWPAYARSLSDAAQRQAWLHRYGWDAPTPPPVLATADTSVRKVEIHEAYDLKRWYWKANDGIRETTWPGVYNQSRLLGRKDYFVLPDWDCYADSGKSVTFNVPDEPWNQIEFAGAAWGKLKVVDAAGTVRAEIDRAQGFEVTSHRLGETQHGQKLVFENAEQETPIQELSVLNVSPGSAPAGVATLNYRLSAQAAADNPNLPPLLHYIRGRHPLDEQATIVAVPLSGPSAARARASATAKSQANASWPLVHVLVPGDFRAAEYAQGDPRFSYGWNNLDGALDGLVLELPALVVPATHGKVIALNVQVRDPIWPARAMLDFNLSVRPGEPRTLWLDLRDRILPNDRPLYLTIASASPDFGPRSLDGAGLKLVFKNRSAGLAEHEIDRFTQARDSFAMLTEEYPNNRRFDLFRRFEADVTDLLRVNPSHALGRTYWWLVNTEQPMPPVALKDVPAGVPAWAVRQTELLGYIRRIVEWYIDHRQIENGEFGGGLSDDGDFTNYFPATALMGCIPEKIERSLLLHLEAYYRHGMFTRGLPTIQTDELHSYEEGIQVLSQGLLLDYGNPKHLERAMETTRGVETITGINPAGHRHIRSSYYSGSRLAEEGVWGWSKAPSYLVLQPAMLLADYGANPRAKDLLISLADGLLAHRHKNADGTHVLHSTIEFATDADAPGRQVTVSAVFWAAWQFTADRKYLEAVLDPGPNSWDTLSANALDQLQLRKDWETAQQRRARVPNDPLSAGQRASLTSEQHFQWQVTGNKTYLENLYTQQVKRAALREYANTEGSVWIDRVVLPFGEIQRARLGGIALQRNDIYPGHVVSWKFAAPASGESVAVLIPDATREQFKVIAYNLEQQPVTATMTGAEVEPGVWEISQGSDADGDDRADQASDAKLVPFGRGESVSLELPPRIASVITLKRTKPATPYSKRPDAGLGRDDVVRDGSVLRVKVHSLGSLPMPASELALVSADGQTIARAPLPPIEAPTDLLPRTIEVKLDLPPAANLQGARVVLDPANQTEEITKKNNSVPL